MKNKSKLLSIIFYVLEESLDNLWNKLWNFNLMNAKKRGRV